MKGHPLLKDQKRSIIVRIVIIVFGFFFINCKVYMSKLDTNQKKIYMFKAFKSQEWTFLVFLTCFFNLPNVHHSFWKLEKILTLMIRKTKGLELMKFVFITHLITFGSKVFLILNFENVILTKVVRTYMW